MPGLFDSKKERSSLTAEDRRAVGRPDFMAKSLNLVESSVNASQEDWLKVGNFKPQSISQWTGSSFSIASTVGAIYAQAITTRRDYLLTSSVMRQHMIYWAILDLVSQDVVNMDDYDETFEFQSDDEKIAKELKDLTERLNLNGLVQDIVTDLIDYGEFALSTNIKPGEGLVGLRDDKQPMDVLAVYENGVPKNFIEFDLESKELQVKEASDYIHFVIGNAKIRVTAQDYVNNVFGGYSMTNMYDRIPDAIKEKLGDFIRFGQPFFWGVLQGIRMLQMLESLPIAIKLNQIAQSHIVQIKMSSATELSKIQEMLNKYEQILNTPIAIDFANKQVTVAEVMPIVGRVKAVPNFLEDSKGAFDLVDVRREQSVEDLIDNATLYRQLICGSLGIPYSLLYGSTDAAQDKVSELRMFSRYTRRLKGIQRAVKRGLIQIAIAHLVNKKGFEGVKRSDIKIIFKRPLTDVGGLEELELNAAKQGLVIESIDFVDRILQNPLLNVTVNKVKLTEWLQKQFECLTDGMTLFDKIDDKTINDLIMPHDFSVVNDPEMFGGDDEIPPPGAQPNQQPSSTNNGGKTYGQG